MKTFKILDAVTFIFLMLFVVFCVYGFATDCPNTAGYVDCSNSEGWSLHFGNQPDTGNELQK